MPSFKVLAGSGRCTVKNDPKRSVTRADASRGDVRQDPTQPADVASNLLPIPCARRVPVRVRRCPLLGSCLRVCRDARPDVPLAGQLDRNESPPMPRISRGMSGNASGFEPDYLARRSPIHVGIHDEHESVFFRSCESRAKVARQLLRRGEDQWFLVIRRVRLGHPRARTVEDGRGQRLDRRICQHVRSPLLARSTVPDPKRSSVATFNSPSLGHDEPSQYMGRMRPPSVGPRPPGTDLYRPAQPIRKRFGSRRCAPPNSRRAKSPAVPTQVREAGCCQPQV